VVAIHLRVFTALITVSGLLGACLPGPGSFVQQRTDVPRTDPVAVMQEADRLAVVDLWPGFDPRAVPVAIYDGERTYLFRHPAPPEGFQPLPDHPGVWTHAGRHPSVTANRSVELGSVLTATVMPSAPDVSLRARAALVIHETFHVFQRKRHPAWSANEVELFAYPVDDAGLLALRRSESEAWRRAVGSSEIGDAICWTRIAMDVRRERFARLPSGSVAYERQSELNEGLPTYVEYRATGEVRADILPAEEFAPEAVRQRAYRTGAALALLLDRVSPDWRATLAQNDSTSLDAMLTAALGTPPGVARVCALTSEEMTRIRTTAAADIQTLRGRRGDQRHEFLGRTGWRIVISAGETPLFPQSFDPLNVQLLAPDVVLHTRFLKLGNDWASIEILGRASLTEAAGAHPLFNGVRTLTVTGLAEEPTVTEGSGAVMITGDGVTAEMRGAVVERSGQTITVRIP
jgi:hypothetical protein